MSAEDKRPSRATDQWPGQDGREPGAAAPRVHVIDDDEAVRRALAMQLRSAGIPVEIHDSGLAFLEALPSLDETSVGCVLVDVRMPGLDGVDLVHRLKACGFRRPVIVMTAHGDVSTAVKAMKAGALDFIEKPFEDEVLLDAIETARRATHDPAASVHDDAAARVSLLSGREREVLASLVAGKPNKLIARELGLSPRTVEVHRARLMARLGVGSLAEAVRLAVRAGMAENDPEGAGGAAL